MSNFGKTFFDIPSYHKTTVFSSEQTVVHTIVQQIFCLKALTLAAVAFSMTPS